jgi:hypothetical protein
MQAVVLGDLQLKPADKFNSILGIYRCSKIRRSTQHYEKNI